MFTGTKIQCNQVAGNEMFESKASNNEETNGLERSQVQLCAWQSWHELQSIPSKEGES
jgi:hypothetical protein